MAHQIDTARREDPGAILPAYQGLATLFAVFVIIQAFLGMRGFVDANDGLVTMHEMLANLMFLMAIGMAVLAYLLSRRGTATMRDVGLNGVLVLLTVAQIGLGYSTRGDSFTTTVSLHVPNGVLMMGVSTAIAVLAWRHAASPARRAVTSRI
jgi:hypothetical protein